MSQSARYERGLGKFLEIYGQQAQGFLASLDEVAPDLGAYVVEFVRAQGFASHPGRSILATIQIGRTAATRECPKGRDATGRSASAGRSICRNVSREYEELLQAPPGITGLSTLKFRNEEQFFQEGSIEAQYVEEILACKLKLALEYERTRSFLSDLAILFRTVLSLASPSAKTNSGAPNLALPAFQKIFRRTRIRDRQVDLCRKEPDSSHRNDELDKVLRIS